MLTETIQDYLKAIYQLAEDGQTASTSVLAKQLGITPASVTGMLQRMAATEPPLIHYRKYRGVTLTPAGERVALEIIRHHRLLETYLVSKLGYSWDEVHEEACRLEHAISEAFEARIDQTLGYPERDPHGDPIPSADLSLPPKRSISLVSLAPLQRAVVRRVGTEEPAFLRHIEQLGLLPGSRIKILECCEFDQVLKIHIDGQGQAIALGPPIAAQIFVEGIE